MNRLIKKTKRLLKVLFFERRLPWSFKFHIKKLFLQKYYKIKSTFIKYKEYKSLKYEKPKVSCLLITKNRFKLARRAIDCWINQSYKNSELIVIEDGTDQTQDYIKNLIKKYYQIRYIRPNKKYSLGSLRNLSLRLAKGKYITQWDDDDWYHSDRIKEQLNFLIKKKADFCFLSRWTLALLKLNKYGISSKRIWEGSIFAKKKYMPCYSEKKVGEDCDMIDILLGRNDKIVLLDKPQLYIYTFHGMNAFDQDHHTLLLRKGITFKKSDKRIKDIKIKLNLN